MSTLFTLALAPLLVLALLTINLMPALTNTAQYKKRTLRKVRIGYDNGTAIAYVDINPNGLALSPDAQELITQGVSSKDKDRNVTNYTLTIDNQYAMPALDEIALKAGSVADTYFGDGIMPGTYYEIETTHTMVHRVSGVTRTEVTRWLKCAITQADPAGGQAEQVVQTQTIFEAGLTTKDIRGVDLTGGIPAGGAFFKKTATEA